MSIGKQFRVLSFVSGGLVLCLSIMIGLTYLNQQKLNDSQEVRYESFLRANELRMSSEDLTRLARTYVVSGEAKYEAMYWDVLAVRGGKKPRPDGKTVALQTLMTDLGFTPAEFDKLREAEANSNNLVKTETIAMNAVKGLYDDGTGKFTRQDTPDLEMARRIMHDDQYHKNKALIGKPIDEFEELLTERNQATVTGYVKSGNIFLALIALLSLSTAASLYLVMRSIRNVLGQVVGQLKTTTASTSASATEMLSASRQLSSAAESQAAGIQETVSALTEISAMIEKSAHSATRSSVVATTSQETAERGKSSVQQVVAAIDDISHGNEAIVEQVEHSNQKLADIIKIIGEIGNKTKVINDIVFQTKLLSFNASVEAARAGEQGKGFAVVAEEVGNLAQMSGNASKEISEMLISSIKTVEEIILDTTRRTKDLVASARMKVTHGTEIAHECGVTLSGVVEVVGEVCTNMSEITTATSEQARGVKEISTAMHQLNATTQESSSVASHTSKCAHDIEQNTRELQQLVETIEREVLAVKPNRHAA